MLRIILTIIFIFVAMPSAFAKKVSVVSWGGAYTNAQKLSMGKYYTQETGKKLKWIDYSGGNDSVRKNKNKWDIVDMYARDVEQGCKEGLYVKLDIKSFPAAPDGTSASDDIIMPGTSECSIPSIFYSWVGAYSSKKFKSGRTPSTAKDFFDVNTFPGVRSLYSGAMSNLEFALVADGIHPNDVYDYMAENGLKRALTKINRLCQDPRGGCIYWSAGAQPVEQIVKGKAVMATGWNGRWWNAIKLENAKIKLMTNTHLLDHEYFAVVNNSNQKAAIEALKIMTATQGSANMAKYIAYSPVRKSSHELILKNEPWYNNNGRKKNVSDFLPAAKKNFPTAIIMDAEWWSLNGNKITDSWESLKSSGIVRDAVIKKTNYSDQVYAAKNKYGLFSTSNTKVATAASSDNDMASKLRTIKELLDEGLINKKDFEKKKAALLGIENETTFTMPSNTDNDQDAPVIKAKNKFVIKNSEYLIKGTIEDKSRVFLEVDGRIVTLGSNNSFELRGYEPDSTSLTLVAFDQYGNKSSPYKISIIKKLEDTSSTISFAPLNPNNLKAKQNKDKIALIVGVEEYKNISDAVYAARDTTFFKDYLIKAIGIKSSNIKTILNKDATYLGTKLSIKKWAKQNIRQNTEVYVYFSGHGMATNNGTDLYLLTSDTFPDFIEESAINRNDIFNDIAQYNPKSVTAFLDTCYSGAGRADGEMLLAMAKGLVVVDEQQQQLPDNFTLFTAASAQESAWSLPEAKHGTFSYFLMKGMEGEADLNNDKKLTNGELQEYLLDNVGRYAQQQQTPQMIGDPNQVLVQF